MSFVHLHNHTVYSLLDGMTQLKPMIAKAVADGQPAIAITDHGSCYGLPTFYSECKKQGIKPILGCEVYEAPSSRFDKNSSEGAYYHLVLLVKNRKGYENLCHLVTKSNTEGFYYKPRIDRELLEQYHEGLICLSGCMSGRIAKDILNGSDTLKDDILWYKNVFGDDFYLEIQNHGIPEEIRIAEELIGYSKECGIKLVCTNDSHYLNSEDKEAHDWLICMQTGKTINDPSRMVYRGDYSVKTEKEMRELYPALPEAFNNTVEIAEKCDFGFEYGNYRMPKVTIPSEYGNDYFGYLKDEAWKGYEFRYPVGHPYREEAKSRLEYELSVVEKMNFAEYFLDTRKTIMWAKEHDILVGVGRGSGAGSCMNYCLQITDIEPLRYGLLFERFLNPERISMPDIDVDYDYAHKDEVIAFEAQSNGLDKFCKIQTIGSMFSKSIVKGCAKVAGYEPMVGNKLAKMIPDNAKNMSDAYGMNPEIEEYLRSDPKIRKLWEIAVKLEGCKKSDGTHACGHIPTPVPCEELFPCRVDEETGYLVCQYDMNEAEHLGNLKKDLLMLRNLTIIDVARRAVKEHYGVDVGLWTEDILYDMDALKQFWNSDTLGIFQFESKGITKVMADLKPDTFEDVVAGVALYRPGPMDFIPDYIEGKKHPEGIKYLVPSLKPILETTYGVIVYQEQVMRICTDLAGFTMGHADVVRKAMGKKKKDIMAEEKPKFIQGCIDNRISEEIAEELWSRMEKFAEYAFNKSHAVCYACISMETAYLKEHYPLEFMAGLLSSVMGDDDKLIPYLTECKRKGIRVEHPDINSSLSYFKAENRDGRAYLTYGLSSIAYVSKNLIDAVVEERKNGMFTSLENFYSRLSGQVKLNKRIMENLVKAGAFDAFGNRHSLMEEIPKLKKSKKEIDGQMSLMLTTPSVKYLDNEPEYDKKTLLQMEKEATGIYLSGHPMDGVNVNKSTKIYLINQESEDNEFHEGKDVIIAGILPSVNICYTKKDHKPMAGFTTEDETGQIRCVVFPKQYEYLKEYLKEDNMVKLKGRLSLDGDKFQLIVDDIREISDKHYYINPQNDDQTYKVRHTLRKGNDTTTLFYDGQSMTKGSNISEILSDIEAIVGKENVIVERC